MKILVMVEKSTNSVGFLLSNIKGHLPVFGRAALFNDDKEVDDYLDKYGSSLSGYECRAVEIGELGADTVAANNYLPNTVEVLP